MGNIVTSVIRKAMTDIEIKGHFIPKGWSVMAYIRTVHYDDDFYEDPYKFNPWRWQVGQLVGQTVIAWLIDK